MFAPNQRSHVDVLDAAPTAAIRRADSNLAGVLTQAVEKGVAAGADCNGDASRHAALARTTVRSCRHALNGLVDLGVWHDDHVVLRAASRLDSLAGAGTGFVNRLRDRRRTNERDRAGERMVNQCLHAFAVPVDDVEDAIRQAGGLAQINHPNFAWAFDHEAISRVKGAHFLEIYNGHPWVNVQGGAGRPGCEEIWDRVLSAGTPIFGVAVDDSHEFKGEFNPSRSNPGRGWIVVRAHERSQEALMDAMRRGDFYSSTGVYLADFELSDTGIQLKVLTREHEWDLPRFTTSFIGSGGRLLAQEFGTEATYEGKSGDGYVRAVVQGSNGYKAWTQPVFFAPE